jgi:hypothetical protein
VIKIQFKNKNGGKTLGFGLSVANIERLMKNEPIAFKLDEFGIEGTDVLIFAGQTEDAMLAEFKRLGMIK